MKKPTIDTRAAIDEQMPYPEGHELDRRFVTGAEMCRVAMVGLNVPTYYPAELYGDSTLIIASNSWGIREIDGEAVLTGTEGKGIDEWGLYDPATVSKFIIGSATSRAHIKFTRAKDGGDGLFAEFHHGHEPSTMYRRLFQALGSNALFDFNLKRTIFNTDDEEFTSYVAQSGSYVPKQEQVRRQLAGITELPAPFVQSVGASLPRTV